MHEPENRDPTVNDPHHLPVRRRNALATHLDGRHWQHEEQQAPGRLLRSGRVVACISTEEIMDDLTTLNGYQEHWNSIWKENKTSPNRKEFDDNNVMAPNHPRKETVLLAELEARESPFQSRTEKERNKREWLRQISFLPAGYIPMT